MAPLKGSSHLEPGIKKATMAERRAIFMGAPFYKLFKGLWLHVAGKLLLPMRCSLLMRLRRFWATLAKPAKRQQRRAVAPLDIWVAFDRARVPMAARALRDREVVSQFVSAWVREVVDDRFATVLAQETPEWRPRHADAVECSALGRAGRVGAPVVRQEVGGGESAGGVGCLLSPVGVWAVNVSLAYSDPEKLQRRVGEPRSRKRRFVQATHGPLGIGTEGSCAVSLSLRRVARRVLDRLWS